MIAFQNNCNIELFHFFKYFYPKIECLTGYYFPGCNLPWRFPSYGDDCQSVCLSCTKAHCNFITGCTGISNVYIMLKIPFQFNTGSLWLSICISVCLSFFLFPRFYWTTKSIDKQRFDSDVTDTMAVEDNQPFLYYSTSETSVKTLPKKANVQ